MMPLPDKDNEFDDLIKAAGDNYQPTGAVPDWEQMQGLLDKHMPARKDKRRRLFILLILLFFLLGGAYLYFAGNNDKTIIQGKHQQTPANSTSRPAPPLAVNPTTKGVTGNDNQKQQTQSLKNNGPLKKQTKMASYKHANSQNKTGGHMKINTSMGETDEKDLAEDTPEVAPSVKKDEIVDTINDSATKITPQSEITGIDNKITGKTASPEATIEENKTPGDKKIRANKKKDNKKSKQPLEIALVYAPELTTIRFSHVDKPGSNYGLLVGYHISKKMAIQTGIIKSRKNYIVNGDDFKLDYTLPANYKLNRAQGYCVMYEIPLNIKSQISQGKKVNLFYTAGISSYFMTKEFYTYNISTNNGSYNKSVKYNSQKNYWLSLATIGMGVEKEITNTLNIAAMPFIKIPFKGMGEGHLKLLSTGINFSLSYKPFLKK